MRKQTSPFFAVKSQLLGSSMKKNVMNWSGKQIIHVPVKYEKGTNITNESQPGRT